MAETPLRDQFGFVIKPGEEQREEPTARKKPRKKTWSAFLKKIGGDPSKIERSKHVKELIRKEGVPTAIRGKVWLAITKAKEHNSLMTYPDILATFDGMESEHTKQIEKDLRRTFPDNAMFESEEGINVLRRVLVAYSWLNPEIGYCQSMNFICALYLLFMEEEDAFWLLKATMEEVLPAGYYTQGMLGVRSDNSVLQQLLSQKLPKVAQHLGKHEVVLDGLTTGWFMCLFVNILPLQATLRVFDSLFLEGSKILFRVGLALFKYHEKAILKETTFEGLYSYINHMAEGTTDSSRLMEESFNKEWMGSMPASKINGMRLSQWQTLQRNLIEESGKRGDAIQIVDVSDLPVEKKKGSGGKPKTRLSRSSSNSDLQGKPSSRNPKIRVLGRSESSSELQRAGGGVVVQQWASKSRPLGLACQAVQKPQPLAGARPRVARNRQRADTGTGPAPKTPAPPPPTLAPTPTPVAAPRQPQAQRSPPVQAAKEPQGPPAAPPPRPRRQDGGKGGTMDARTQQLIDSRFSARLRPFSILVSSPGSLELLPPIRRPPRETPPHPHRTGARPAAGQGRGQRRGGGGGGGGGGG
eukprot:CAMPEP_0114604878 /NCGR_PEP_ID=MMETSP0168-20121206/770_1 /TAXON_ID=95228 ORGANISM="Vannella sp., Strain DIVA3 517/6/12" /NCGR_SAMPLE_ID=MMETSP0168 /ASSEMBLY_ACC=CAM_ASM_000044 /LENGTH=582 /DNA_ID=CAMNT_0001815719 /DNA_START=97 /DNA_END=1841 /DNA_ORIENTATION=+